MIEQIAAWVFIYSLGGIVISVILLSLDPPRLRDAFYAGFLIEAIMVGGGLLVAGLMFGLDWAFGVVGG